MNQTRIEGAQTKKEEDASYDILYLRLDFVVLLILLYYMYSDL